MIVNHVFSFGHLYGTIKDKSGNAFNAFIHTPPEVEFRMPSPGEYFIFFPKEDIYLITVAADGYEPQDYEVTVGGNKIIIKYKDMTIFNEQIGTRLDIVF